MQADPNRESSLADLQGHCEALGSRPALVLRGRYRSRTLTYGDLARAAAGTATRLAETGIGPGDRVLIRGPDSPEWAASFLGCLHLGAVAVPLDRSSDDRFAARVRQRAGCRAAILPRGDLWDPGVARLELETRPGVGPAPPVHRARRGDLLEVVFTSGTTGDPRGVSITHGNILAYLEPIEAGYRRRRWYVRPFLPLRLLSLPPLSHLFGQAAGIFLPLMLGCTVVFLETLDPAGVRRAIRSERIWLAMMVPRMLSMLTAHVRVEATRHGWDLEGWAREAGRRGAVARAWAARQVQVWLGWRFRGFVVGGARLDPYLEQFWRDLGYVLVQGYGLTETAPVVTLTHPFRPRPGSVGRPLRGQELRLAEDGEILVRGANVMSGYWEDPAATARVVDADGWLHTGDLGARDPDGSLRVLGRKKEVIVPPDGWNVHPEDVERELRLQEGVRDAMVLGVPVEGGEAVHAVLLLAPDGPEAAAAVAATNRRLEPHQRIRGFTVWPHADFPRTATGKARRREVERALVTLIPGGPAADIPAEDPLVRILVLAGADRSQLGDGARLDDLGLGSLDLVEVAAAMEEAFGVEVADGVLSGETSVAELRRLACGARPAVESPAVPFPRWPCSAPARAVRALARGLVILPATAVWTPLRVEGREHLAGLGPGALVVANHVSLLDVPVLLRALPRAWRGRIAPAITADYFRPWLRPEGFPRRKRYLRCLQWGLAALLFQAFLLPREQGFRESLRHAGDLVDAGRCPLVFPEGTRSATGMGPFQAGIGLMAARLGVPVVPAHLDGMESVLPPDARWPRRAPVRVRFGAPLRPAADELPETMTERIEFAVRALAGGTAAR